MKQILCGLHINNLNGVKNAHLMISNLTALKNTDSAGRHRINGKIKVSERFYILLHSMSNAFFNK